RAAPRALLDGRLPTALTEGTALPAGIRLGAPGDGEVRLGTAAGTALTLERSASLTVAEAGSTLRFTLHTGAVRARVAPLLAGERFIVDAGSAQIEVHGTAFRVAIVTAGGGCADARRTAVTVSEGVVTVRARGDEARLTAGTTWQSPCAPVAAIALPGPAHRRAAPAAKGRLAAPRSDPTPTAPAPPAGTRAEAAPAPVPVPVPVPASVLAAQNDLFAAAVRAKNHGRADEAAALFARLALEYPQGPLAESAAAQRIKVLAAGGDRAAAVRAAREYLDRYPAGFARADAERLRGPAAP
ncbi:MAG TPA: FecR domain-containing protein, partial [Polyangia bacterium]|nr:FecR domain-containing protein [Polyangia bacterium]